MQTLIVSDVHEQMARLWNIEELLMPQADRVIMLGDFFDKFGQKQAKDAAQWVKDHIHNDKFDICWGNHDTHYAFKHPYFKCSGYNQSSKIEIDSVLATEDWLKFKPFVKVGKFLISHAGFHELTLDMSEGDYANRAVDLAFAGEYDNFWAAGKARGGATLVGGPTWLDWRYEFVPLSVPQIVGHTEGEFVRTKVNDETGVLSICLDTGLKHVIWTDGEKVDVVKLD